MLIWKIITEFDIMPQELHFSACMISVVNIFEPGYMLTFCWGGGGRSKAFIHLFCYLFGLVFELFFYYFG